MRNSRYRPLLMLLPALLAQAALTQESPPPTSEPEAAERRFTPTSLIPHRANYILPFTWTSDTGNRAQTTTEPDFQLDNAEFQFQLSVKFPLRSDFLIDDSSLWLGYTVRSFWQAYNTDISRPFRETNHEPELIWEIPSTIELAGFRNLSNALVLNHQSNGQSGPLSRSWNRVKIDSLWERDNLILQFSPWAKLPHEITPDANFDEDNPDILDYLGNFELMAVYRLERHAVFTVLRNNLRSENRGAVQIGWAFPLHPSFHGVITYFNGYGESLIDYKHSQQRLSIGILMSTSLSSP